MLEVVIIMDNTEFEKIEFGENTNYWMLKFFMAKYRIKKKFSNRIYEKSKYYVQERRFFFFWITSDEVDTITEAMLSIAILKGNVYLY